MEEECFDSEHSSDTANTLDATDSTDRWRRNTNGYGTSSGQALSPESKLDDRRTLKGFSRIQFVMSVVVSPVAG